MILQVAGALLYVNVVLAVLGEDEEKHGGGPNVGAVHRLGRTAGQYGFQFR